MFGEHVSGVFMRGLSKRKSVFSIRLFNSNVIQYRITCAMFSHEGAPEFSKLTGRATIYGYRI